MKSKHPRTIEGQVSRLARCGEPEWLYKLERGTKFFVKVRPEAVVADVEAALGVIEAALADADAEPDAAKALLWTVGSVPPEWWGKR